MTVHQSERVLQEKSRATPYRVQRIRGEVRTCDDGSIVLAMVKSTHTRGFSGPTSEYSSWKTNEASFITQRPDGVLERRSFNGTSWTTLLHYDNTTSVSSARDVFVDLPSLREALHRYVDMDAVPTFQDHYPLIPDGQHWPYALVRFYRDASDLDDVCRVMFGIRRSSRPTFREAFRLGQPDSRYNAYLLRGIISDDALMTMMSYRGRLMLPLRVRKIARGIPAKIIEAALAENLDSAMMHLSDLSLRDIPAEATTLQEIHDIMARRRRRQISSPDLLAVMNPRFVRVWNTSMPSEDVQTFTRTLFGSQYRRDLVKAIAHCSPRTVYIGWLFFGLVPIDWIIDFYRREINQGMYSVPGRHFRKVISTLDESSRRKLLRLNGRELSNISRVGRDPRAIIPTKIESVRRFGELYDRQEDRLAGLMTSLDIARTEKMSEADRRRMEEERRDQEHRSRIAQEQSERVNGVTKAGRRIEMATSFQQLAEWGETLDHCIADYANRLGNDILGAVYEHDILAYTFHISEGVLFQLYGYKNHILSPEASDDVLTYLEPLCSDSVDRTRWMKMAQNWGTPAQAPELRRRDDTATQVG